MSKYLLIPILLLSACATTVGPADVACSIDLPTFTVEELRALSKETLKNLDLYAERMAVFCKR